MLSVAVLSLFFNLIQIKILHSGEGGHVHAGGQPCSGHGANSGHAHDHSHAAIGHNHEHHDHEHGHDHSHNHSHDNGHNDELVHSHDHNSDDHQEVAPRRNLNIDAAFLHILGDLLNSVGVIVAATIVFFWPQLWMVDPICTYLFGAIVLWTTR